MCGIAGIITKSPRTFDYSAFAVMGIANDSRGGDSCGVFIDGKYEYGVGPKKFFQNYFPESDLLAETKKSQIAFLHCRKASVGNISEATAQPVVITDEKGNVEYVLMHNGTIHNYKELAEKYIPDADITGMTDSQVMAQIFYNAGYDALDEYNGGAVFAIADYRGYVPEVLLFKGASKKTKYSKEKEVERPLAYCINKGKQELLFSSIGIHLLALRPECEAYLLKENVLWKFTGTTLTAVSEYSRDNVQQNKEIETIRTYRGGCSYPLYGRQGFIEEYEYPTNNFIGIDHTYNVYSHSGKKAHGRLYLTKYGRICPKHSKDPKTYEVWFYAGVALKDEHCFKFLENLRKEARLEIPDFYKKFETVVRFLSIDGVYPRGDFYYKTISPTGSVLFNGTLQHIGAATREEYIAGKKKTTSYGQGYDLLESRSSKKSDINFKTVREACKPLMR